MRINIFFHDALTQMSDSCCVQWMKEVGVYSRWIKPELGCNDVIVAMKNGEMKTNTRYKGRPVGNSPELCPLDNSCFRDFRTNLSLNVAATWKLPRSDLRKFSISTPKEISRAIVRLWDPNTGTSPTSHRILQDVKRIPHSCYRIAEYGGKIVPGLADRNGHRRENLRVRRAPRFNRDDVTLGQLGIHESIRGLVENEYRKEKEKFGIEVEESMVLTEASLVITAPSDDAM